MGLLESVLGCSAVNGSGNVSAPVAMRRPVGVWILILALLVVAVGEVKSVAAKSKRTVVVCNNDIAFVPTIETRPSDCVLYDGRSYMRINDLKWKNWGGKRAVARGKIFPKESRQPTRVRLVLTRLDSTRPCPYRWYSRATIRIVSGPFTGRRTVYSRPAAGDCGLY